MAQLMVALNAIPRLPGPQLIFAVWHQVLIDYNETTPSTCGPWWDEDTPCFVKSVVLCTSLISVCKHSVVCFVLAQLCIIVS